MLFQYSIELKDGYRPTMETDEEKDVSIIIETKNRATADRMIKALLKDATNINSCIGFAIDYADLIMK